MERSATSQAKGRRSIAVRAAKMAAVPVKAPRASTETATDIRPIFKLVPVVSPPRTFSKLRLINAPMSRNLWPAVRDWLDASGYYDLFVAQPLAASSGFALRAQATRPLRGGRIPKTSAKTTRSSPPPAPASPSPNPKSPPSSPMLPPPKGTITTWKRAAFCHFPPFEKSPPACIFPSNVIKCTCFSIGVLYP